MPGIAGDYPRPFQGMASFFQTPACSPNTSFVIAHRIRNTAMPTFVVIISLLSLLSFAYSISIVNQEIHRFQMVTQPFGGTLERMVEQVTRLTISLIFTGLSLATVFMSAALVWLALQPTMVG
jgi:hypothetical protein